MLGNHRKLVLIFLVYDSKEKVEDEVVEINAETISIIRRKVDERLCQLH